MEVLGWRSDAELVDGIRRGEDFAFGRLFERWFGRVLGEAQDILGDPQGAAEVATDTFHALWYHLDRLDDPDGFGAWAVETSRTFARERLASPQNREEAAPVPMLATAPDAAAAVAVALVARGLPSAAGLGDALHAASGAIGSPFGPSAAGSVGSTPAPAGFAGAVPAAPSPAGFAGAVPGPPQLSPAGFAGNASGPGFAGTPGSGSILGGPVGQAAEMGTQAMPSLGAFGAAADEPLQRLHRYEPPSRSGLLGSPQALAGIAATVVLILVGALFLATRGDDNETATDAVSTTTAPPAAPSASAPSSAPAGTEAPTSTAGSTSEASIAPATEAPTTSTTRQATTSSTRASTASTTTATSASTTASTTAPTTATTAPTTASSQPTTSSSSVTRTTPTTAPTTTPTTEPKPVIGTFTVAANPNGSCVGAAAKLLPYTATWSATNADTSSLAVNGVTYDGKAKDSRNFCALSGTRVTLTVTGPGGDASLARTTR